jgi:hypothetical protein
MIMHAGEERAARRRVGERREPLGEYLQPSPEGEGRLRSGRGEVTSGAAASPPPVVALRTGASG